MITGLLGLLKWAPAVLEAGRQVVSAVTGEELPEDTTPENLTAKIESLPAEQRAEVIQAIVQKWHELDRLDTKRFEIMAGQDAETQRASARPEIARRAMSVIEIFSKLLAVVFAVTIAQWLIGVGYVVVGAEVPDLPSFWRLLAEAEPVTELIWAPLLASFACCVAVIRKYFGCRERDKAREDEMWYGAPLGSTQATIEAAGSGVAGIIKALRGK